MNDLFANNAIQSIRNGDLENLKYLTTKNYNLIDHKLELLHLAVKENHSHIIAYLLMLGADVNQLDKHGNTPLSYVFTNESTIKRNLEIIKLLLVYGANPNLYKENLSPLHLAAQINSPDLIVRLLLNQAKLEAKDKEGNTPLHIAAMHGSISALKTLIESGATIPATNYHHKTAEKLYRERCLKSSGIDNIHYSYKNSGQLFCKTEKKTLLSPDSWLFKRTISNETRTPTIQPHQPVPYLSVSKMGLFKQPLTSSVVNVVTNLPRILR